MQEEKFYNTIWKRKLKRKEFSSKESRESEALKLLGRGNILLDIGCGNGNMATMAEGRFSHVIGIDVSKAGLSDTPEKKMTAIQSNLNFSAIPLLDNSVDAAVCLDVIEHLFDPLHLVEEVWRVLKNGGEFILTTPNTRFIRHISDLVFRGISPKTSLDKEGYDGGHLHYFTFADLKQILIRSNFTVIEEIGFSKRFYNSIKLNVFYLFSKLWEKSPTKEFFCQGILIKAVKQSSLL